MTLIAPSCPWFRPTYDKTMHLSIARPENRFKTLHLQGFSPLTRLSLVDIGSIVDLVEFQKHSRPAIKAKKKQLT